MTYPARVRVVEVGPRDGLQNEPSTVPTEAKVALIEALADAGLTSIEAGSFVSPKWVPQMADTTEVLARLRPRPEVDYPVLVPNLRGSDRILACGMLDGMGIETGIDLGDLAEAGRSISRHLNLEPASKVARAMAARQQASS